MLIQYNGLRCHRISRAALPEVALFHVTKCYPYAELHQSAPQLHYIRALHQFPLYLDFSLDI